MLHYHCCVANSQLFFVLLRKFVFPKCITLKSRFFIFCHAQLFSSIHFLNEFIQKDIILKYMFSNWRNRNFDLRILGHLERNVEPIGD